MGGDLGLARSIAEAFIRDADARRLATESCAGRRILGVTLLAEGRFVEAGERLEQALAGYDPQRDAQARFRFTIDPRAAAEMNLAHVKWQLGEFDSARALAKAASDHAEAAGHPSSIAVVCSYGAILDMHRRDTHAVARAAGTLRSVGRQYDLKYHLAFADVYSAWAAASEQPTLEASQGLHSAIDRLKGDHGVRFSMPFFLGALAELMSDAEEPAGALACVDEAMCMAREHGRVSADAFLHSVRGAILLKCDAANQTAVEQAYGAAIAVGKKQGARTYGLVAALALARGLQSTGRLVEAHTTLSAALEGLAPTPEMPEIGKAHKLIEQLA